MRLHCTFFFTFRTMVITEILDLELPMGIIGVRYCKFKWSHLQCAYFKNFVSICIWLPSPWDVFLCHRFFLQSSKHVRKYFLGLDLNISLNIYDLISSADAKRCPSWFFSFLGKRKSGVRHAETYLTNTVVAISFPCFFSSDSWSGIDVLVL